MRRWIPALALTVFGLAGCSEYWWTRGQPSSPAELLERADSRLAHELSVSKRSDITDEARAVRESLGKALDALRPGTPAERFLSSTEEVYTQFLSLESELSIGSRAAFGELSGQLRLQLASGGELRPADAEAFKLLGSRVLFFLASELRVSPPHKG